ncbi:hypothetical protein EAG_03164 [Camponotus floridanus]|uniref:Uncharacterized protein n=1 Tax=Camponotus floridanus TaxID=104421 RepID=E2ATE9_CAMFO|nr:hypothetical protein EAG_03164 [Camponotus floridanus]
MHAQEFCSSSKERPKKIRRTKTEYVEGFTTNASCCLRGKIHQLSLLTLNWSKLLQLDTSCGSRVRKSHLSASINGLEAYGFAIRDPGGLARVIYQRNIFIDVWVLPFQKEKNLCEILNFLVHSERLEETTKNKTDHNNRVITDRLLKASLSSTLDEIRGFFADEPDGGNEHMLEESSPLGSTTVRSWLGSTEIIVQTQDYAILEIPRVSPKPHSEP